MSTSKIKQAMLDAGHTIKPSNLLFAYVAALWHSNTCMEVLDSHDNCIRALAIDITTNMWAAKYLLPALEYTQFVIRAVPSNLYNVNYTEIRNTLRQLRHAVDILKSLERGILAMHKARVQVYTAAISWNKPVDNELCAELNAQSNSILKQLETLGGILKDTSYIYHRKLKGMKHEARNSK